MMIDNDEAGFNTRKDVRCLRDGGQMWFLVRGHGLAIARVGDDGRLELWPERSAAHRALLAAIGAAGRADGA